jgi:hypothetical protein
MQAAMIILVRDSVPRAANIRVFKSREKSLTGISSHTFPVKSREKSLTGKAWQAVLLLLHGRTDHCAPRPSDFSGSAIF